MTYYEAALQVLRSARRPLTTREVTDRALAQGLITPVIGGTPRKTMAAVLYRRGKGGPELVRIEDSESGRAKRSTVRWTLRTAIAASPDPRTCARSGTSPGRSGPSGQSG
jgi:HB1, ASXL, restriction endonuclease HTH domain